VWRPDCVRQGDKECGYRAACRILTYLPRRKMETARSSEMLACTSDPYTGVQSGGPQSEHSLQLKNLKPDAFWARSRSAHGWDKMFFECWELHSSGLLDSKKRKFLTDVSGQPIGPFFKSQESKKELPLLAA